ncbi:MAG: hypothetical protein HBSAPP02_15660 [Phycisphaerae bacterium]|nr:MAG: hypothetical protein HRU71_06950 [Planctomycetia bacterium]RIK71409.1 MAG: hypothetical protein DCC66_02145 [Planctomycetota bacterium]GJQ26534.1 MAG: hypothetical protein HBSAPP02_15660 [Phycisphaerae bacterium]
MRTETLKRIARRSMGSVLCLLALGASLPLTAGCGVVDGDCLDNLFDDLDDADDNEEIGEAWDDFFECLDD